MNLAAGLDDGFADLPGDQLRERLEVGPDQLAEVGDHLTTHRRRHPGPGGLSGPGRTARVGEGLGVRERNLRDDLVTVGGVDVGLPEAAGLRRLAADGRGNHQASVVQPVDLKFSQQIGRFIGN